MKTRTSTWKFIQTSKKVTIKFDEGFTSVVFIVTMATLCLPSSASIMSLSRFVIVMATLCFPPSCRRYKWVQTISQVRSKQTLLVFGVRNSRSRHRNHITALHVQTWSAHVPPSVETTTNHTLVPSGPPYWQDEGMKRARGFVTPKKLR